jgi:hypothetical protein
MKIRAMLSVLLIIAAFAAAQEGEASGPWLTLDFQPFGYDSLTTQEAEANTEYAGLTGVVQSSAGRLERRGVNATVDWRILHGGFDTRYFFDLEHFYYRADLGTRIHARFLEGWDLQFFLDLHGSVQSPSPFGDEETSYAAGGAGTMWFQLLNVVPEDTGLWHTLRVSGRGRLDVGPEATDYLASTTVRYRVREAQVDVPLQDRRNETWMTATAGWSFDRLQYYGGRSRSYLTFGLFIGSGALSWLDRSLGIAVLNGRLGLDIDIAVGETVGIERWAVVLSTDDPP